VALTIGEVNETVTVESGASAVQSQSVEISQIVTERRVKELPLNGRNFQRLVLLAPGVGGTGSSVENNPAISGARPTYNNYTVDGLNANDERLMVGLAGLQNGSFTDLGYSVPNVVSTEAIQEFRIITSNADATFGRGSGGQINIITKSGSNQFHGSAFEYLRNEAFDARDFFNNGPIFDAQGRSKVPPYKQHLYGGTFGGRIWRDRHFFFGSYEGLYQRRREQSAVTTVVPNAALINLVPGDLGKYLKTYYLDRGIAPATGNPAGAFQLLPASDRTAAINAGFNRALFDGDVSNGEAGTVLISTAPPRNVDQRSILIRTDHKLTDRLNANVRYQLAPSSVTGAASAVAIDRLDGSRSNQSAIAQLVYTLTPAQTLEARAGYLRNRFQQGPKGGIDPRLQALGVPDLFGIGVGAGLFDASVTSAFIDNQTTPQEALTHTWTRGRFTLRSGFDLRQINLNVANISAGRPNYTFANTLVGANGILGASPAQTQAVALTGSFGAYGVNGGPRTPMRGYRSKQQEYFTQADWQARRDVTLNLGLRYSYFGVYREVNNAVSNLYAVDASGKIVDDVDPFKFGRTANVMAIVNGDRPFYQPDRNNLQPRVGVAWDIGGRGRTVVRAGYGVFYDRLIQLQFTGVVTNVPNSLASSAANVPFQLGVTLPVNAAATPRITAVDPTIRNPRTQRFNLAFEQQLDRATSVTVAYVAARGDGLFSQGQENGFGGVPQASRPDPRYSTQQIIRTQSSSRYQSLQAQARRRLARGVDFTVAYTLSRSLDDSSSEAFNNLPVLNNQGASAATGFQGGGAQFVPRPRRSDWGLSSFDITHNLTVSHLLELPFGKGRALLNGDGRFANAVIGGWSLAGVAVLRSGAPFNVTRGVDFNDDGDVSTDRPALISGRLSDFYASGRGRTQFLLPQVEALTLLNTPASVADPFAQIERNAFRAPRVIFYDLSLIKQFAVTERVRLGFEANAFNIFNRAQLAAPVATLTNARFGQITGTLDGSNPRQIQFGLKLTF